MAGSGVSVYLARSGNLEDELIPLLGAYMPRGPRVLLTFLECTAPVSLRAMVTGDRKGGGLERSASVSLREMEPGGCKRGG